MQNLDYKTNRRLRRKFRRKFRRKLSTRKVVAPLLLPAMFAGMIVLYIMFEYQVVEIDDLFETLWFSMVTMTTTGYGDIIPKTFGGRVIAVCFMLVGIVSTSYFTAAVSSFLLNEKLFNRDEIRRLKKMRKHTMILGYKEELHLLVRDILIYENDLKPEDIVIVNTNANENLKETFLAHGMEGINFVEGDRSEEAVLLKAGIKNAQKAIVVSSNLLANDAESIDAQTAVVVMMLRSLNPNLYICAEVITEKYKRHLHNFKCDEVIHGPQYTRFLLASAANYAGITNVVDKLLNRGDNALLALIPIERKIIGCNFKEIFNTYKNERNQIVIGVIENMGAEILLKKEAIDEAQKTTDMSSLVANLKAVRELEKNKAIINPDDDYIFKKNSALIVIKKLSLAEMRSEEEAML